MEFAVEDTVKNKAIAAGWLVRKLKWIGRKGAPDNLFGKAGRTVFVEFKGAGKEPEGQQAREIKRMRDAGFEVAVIDNVADGLKLLGIEP